MSVRRQRAGPLSAPSLVGTSWLQSEELKNGVSAAQKRLVAACLAGKQAGKPPHSSADDVRLHELCHFNPLLLGIPPVSPTMNERMMIEMRHAKSKLVVKEGVVAATIVNVPWKES